MLVVAHRIGHRFLFAFLMIFLLLNAGTLSPSTAAGQGKDPSSWDSHPLLRMAQESGTVRVIVGLNIESKAEGTLSTSEEITEQRARIVQAQEALMVELIPFNVTAGKRFTYVPGMVLEVDTAGLKHLLESPQVRSVEADELLFPMLDDSVDLIDADQLHDLDLIGTGQSIAILDTGVNASHSFLTGKVVAERCISSTFSTQNASTFCPNGQDEQSGTGAGRPCPLPGCEHGTHVAGIAVGGTVGSGGSPASGVAPGARVIAIQVFSRFTDGQPTADKTPCADRGRSSPCTSAFFSDVIIAMERVFELRTTFNIAAVNLSLGAGSRTAICDSGADIPKSTVDNLLSVGIATVVAAGNSSHRDAIGSPACISTVVSVGATTKSDVVASYSDISSFVTLLAPGSAIRSSVPGDFATFDGTSMAAPHVAGAIALLKAARPTAPISEIILALRTTGPLIRDTRTGGTVSKRRINVREALAALGNVDSNDFRILTVGQSLAGTISPATDQDIYYFDAIGGQAVTIRMGRTDKGLLNSFFTLFRPDGRVLVSDDNGAGVNGDALISLFPLPDTGRYRIRAKSSGGATVGGYSLSLSATASSSNPVPRITSMSPDSTVFSPSMTSFTARINGYNFVPGSVVRLNGVDLPTTFLSSTRLNVRVIAALISSTGGFSVRVFSPTPGGGLSNTQTFTVLLPTVGESEFSPSLGESTVGITTTYVLTWTHPVRWRDLNSLDVRLRNKDNESPLWIRFTEGTTSTLHLLNSAETLVASGTPGEPRVLESETVRLFLAESLVQGTGADGPSVTLTFTVAFKGEAMGQYNLELSALDDDGTVQGPDTIGSWTIRGPDALYLPFVGQ